jgi:hypothetical protein
MNTQHDGEWTAWKDDPDLMGKQGDWFFAKVLDGCERKFASICKRHNIRFFLPRVVQTSSQKPDASWPSYFFCQLSHAQRALLEEERPWVHTIQPVTDIKTVIEEFRRLSSDLGQKQSRQVEPKVGDWVEIKRGPFANHFGTFGGFKRNGKTVSVKLEVLGKHTEIEMDSDSLGEPVDGSRELILVTKKFSKEDYSQVDIAFAPLNAELVRQLSRKPELLYEMHCRRFEELVAEILHDMGFDVQLTPASRDGGRDILAIFKLPIGEMLTVVECKRYARDRHIGPDIVRQLLWVADRHDNASKAMIATTSFFTAGAEEMQKQFRWRLSLADFDLLGVWLKQYGQWRASESSGIWIPR